MAQREVGVDELYAVLCIVDGTEIEITDDIFRDVWFTVDDTHHLLPRTPASVRFQSFYVVCTGYAPIVLCTMHVLSGGKQPHPQKDLLKCVDLVTLDPTVHIVPRPYHLRTFYIIVGHIHAARVGDLPVDDDDLAVVTVEEVVQPWELHRLELIDFNALFTDCLQMPFLHRTVVACIAETVEDSPHFNAILCLCGQMAY